MYIGCTLDVHALTQGSKAPWIHTAEGPDDMPAHVKSSLFSSSLTIPVTRGQLNLGTWQVRVRLLLHT